jgi:alkyl sulfatase BDS1-like metallo-beta-lactamase superfamily hydrolase
VVGKARDYADAGDPRFAAELLNHAVFAAPGNTAAKDLLADVYERLGFGAECGTTNLTPASGSSPPERR